MSEKGHYLQEKINELVKEEEPITRQILLKTIEIVNQRNLSIEALAKKVDREIDRIISLSEQGGEQNDH
jgi:hypothetical protein